jgi:preprotein translocase subunit SecG
MASTLFIVQFALAVVLIIFVLLQKSSSIGLGAYSGSNDSLFGAKGPGNFLAKGTFFVGTLFVINTVSLGYIYNQERLSSAVDSVKVDTLIPQSIDTPVAAPVAPIAPSAPVAK